MKLTDVIEENYEKIDKKEITKIKVEKNQTTEALLKLFSEYLVYERSRMGKNFDPKAEFPFLHWLYPKIVPFLENINPEEIMNISTCLGESKYEEHLRSAGTFLTALINVHYESTNEDVEYKIITSHLENKIANIGRGSKAKIRVYGNGGSCLGMQLAGGTITVEGDCDSEVGLGMSGGMIFISGNVHKNIGAYMSGGTITISGNVGKNVGDNMTNGKITIKGNVKDQLAFKMDGGVINVYGNAGECIGIQMTNGTVYLHGTFEHISKPDFINGKIYHQGKLIHSGWKQFFKNGKKMLKSIF